jgi:hypothetical protein
MAKRQRPEFMRANWLSNRIFKSFDDIVDHCYYAWTPSSISRRKSCQLPARDWAVAGYSL